ncbi:Isocitrate dehydrogenase [NAD] catalytic subunit 5, mitochondrial [Tepidanaerobacter acetatoxydans Re1]|uniref:Isocitrate dehydrogenase [NAD] catalytic subunit 5, mitochondrial n=1 Tax=Tepidanaerobacter acetatoxydans (strain DSM 21804 / JCM 16047 / Re1) TaxID=1209989 RepID=F4LSA2_TEPAE|nr:isocitrate/isopropylmalate dehydrogenase family protein [Tepidanaerobacter acetatoxydans]AEE90365.1 Isocitrate dehydrogenase (NAD(+)) [Tepidanaerobacter acetatoxydans Re1]CCP24857.1 Isocitrate dehydrogenase [NAD] catalytic subunit 5, mitochondrial [Tepidanaerobacter acetatoxydans Re1]
MHKITLIFGDGIGPEITEAVKTVIAAAGVDILWDVQEVGQKALKAYGNPLPDAAIESIKANKIALKGPVTTQIGNGFKSINVTLRQTFDLYANIRPVKSLPGVKTPFTGIDMVIFRENTEDLYAGIENVINEDRVEAIKAITRKASRRIAERAFEYAHQNNRKKVTAVHKANIMKKADGLFLEEVRKAADKYSDIAYDELIVDNACMKLVQQPQKFDVIVTENLYGDIISDLCAGLVGGLGVVPGMNVGEECMIFEAVHGSAPDIAGKNIANPLALLMSAVEMLKAIGETEAADSIQSAIYKLLKEGKCLTPDLGGSATTSEVAQELCRLVAN